MNTKEINALSHEVIGAALEVHRLLGPGLLEHIYQEALLFELHLRHISATSEVIIPVHYKGSRLTTTYRADIIVENEIIVELKATEYDNPLYSKQLLTYLKVSGKRLGLLINFNHTLLSKGITRIVNNL